VLDVTLSLAGSDVARRKTCTTNPTFRRAGTPSCCDEPSVDVNGERKGFVAF
jgi:hypothetical protein